MKRKASLFIRLYKVKSLIKNYAILFVFLTSFVLILINKTEHVFLTKTSSFTTDIIAPILDVFIFPAQMLAKGYDNFIEAKSNIEINKSLQDESKELAVIKNKLAALEVENKILANMLNYKKQPQEKFITARVIAEEESAFSQSLIVYIGKDSNIKKGQVVLSNNSLVGRVENVGKLYAKILLATDINSNIPIMIQKQSTRGMLVGNNKQKPLIKFLPIDANINIGDNVTTSGVAGIFPSGLVIGKISSIDKNNVKVNLNADFTTLEYVQIVDYQL